MSELTFITPSFRGDADRFALLRRSIRRFYRGEARHIVVVPKEDVSMFKKITDDDNIEFLIQNDFVSSIFYPKKWYSMLLKIAPSQVWRFEAHAGRPGWIIQQIVRMSLPEMIHQGAAAYLDSDLVFLRPFDDSDLEVTGKRRFLVRREQTTESGKHRKQIVAARHMLRLPPGSTEHHYMCSPTIWYPDWVLELRKYLESVHEKHWQNIWYETKITSSYSIYGVFVEEVLRPHDLVVLRRPFHYTIWDRRSFERFVPHDEGNPDVNPNPLCLVVQSNLGIKVDEYIKRIEALWDMINKTST